MKTRDTLLTLASLWCSLALSLDAADWPMFHGPNGLGVSSEKNLPTRWSRTENVAWRLELPGVGASSPVVAGDRVYLTSQTEDTGLHVIAISASTGKILWNAEVGKGKQKSHQFHNMATPTPALADGKIYVRFGTGHVAGLDASGKILWQRNLSQEFGDYNANHGMGTSPVFFDGKVYVACMHQGPSYLIALDAVSGTTVWKKDRNLGPKDESQDSYSTPILVDGGGRTELVLAGAEAVNAYDPLRGDEIWVHGGMKVPHPYGRTISGPAAGDGVVVVVASGFQNRGFTLALNAAGQGNRPESDRLWTSTKFSPDCGTPLVYQGKVYSMRDDGIASRLDAKTGVPDWQERLYTANVKVSPVAADGKIYFTNGQGNCAVVKADAKLEVVSLNELNEPTLASPAISGGHLYIRTEKALYKIGK